MERRVPIPHPVGEPIPYSIFLWDHPSSVYLEVPCNTTPAVSLVAPSFAFYLLGYHLLSVSLSLHIRKVRIGYEADFSVAFHRVTHIGPICKQVFPSSIGRETKLRSLSRLVSYMATVFRVPHEVSPWPGSRR